MAWRRRRRAAFLSQVEELVSSSTTTLDRIHSVVGEFDVSFSSSESSTEDSVDDGQEKIERERESEEESLFALQVYVENVDLLIHTPEQELALGFRLMDFPTILIQSKKKGNTENSVRFDSGKSCLFKMEREKASELFAVAPVYFLLIETLTSAGPEEQQQVYGEGKLLGSTSVDLSEVCKVSNMVSDVVLPGPHSLWGWRRGTVPLFDLMGNRVALCELRLRLCHFGDGLLPHIEQASQVVKNSSDHANPQQQKEEEEFDDDDEYGGVRLERKLPIPMELLRSMKKLHARLDSLEGKKALGSNKAQQTRPRSMMKTHLVVKGNDIREQEMDDDGCWLPQPGQIHGQALPPPMYYKKARSESDNEYNLEESVEQDQGECDHSEDAVENLLEKLENGDDQLRERFLKALGKWDVKDVKKPNSPIHRHQRSRRPSTSSSTSSSKFTKRSTPFKDSSRQRGENLRGENNDDSSPQAHKKTHGALKIRKTRAQIMRERANYRKYRSSISKELGEVSTGRTAAEPFRMVQLTADLARAKELNERDIEERKYLMEKRTKATRRSQSLQDSGKMHLQSLVGSSESILLSAEEQERYVRSKQLELLWQGKLEPQPAFQKMGADGETKSTNPRYSSSVNTFASPTLLESSSFSLPPPPPPPHSQTTNSGQRAITAMNQRSELEYLQEAQNTSMLSSLSTPQTSSMRTGSQSTGNTRSTTVTETLSSPTTNLKSHGARETHAHKLSPPKEHRQQVSSKRGQHGTSSSSSSSVTSRYGRSGMPADLETFVISPFPEDHDGMYGSEAPSLANSRYHDFDTSQKELQNLSALAESSSALSEL